MLPYHVSPSTLSKEPLSFDRTRRNDVHPDPGRPRTSIYVAYPLANPRSAIVRGVLTISPGRTWPVSSLRIVYNNNQQLSINPPPDVTLTLFGLLSFRKTSTNCLGSATDNKVCPSAASAAATRTLKSLNVRVILFEIPGPPCSRSIVPEDDDGVSMRSKCATSARYSKQ